MKSGLMKRIVAFVICIAMLTGDMLPVIAEHNTEKVNSMMTVSGNNSVSGGDAVVTLAPVTVDGVTITVSGPASALKQETELRVTQLDPIAVETVEEALAAEETEKKISVQKYKAFDITLLVDGEVVQPDGRVKVSFTGDILVPEKEEDVTVYHVTEDAVANEMTEVVAENDMIEMVTDHFSTYVIVITGNPSGAYNITYQHYNNEGIQLFKSKVDTIQPETGIIQITDLKEAGKTTGGDNYTLTQIKVIPKLGSAQVIDLTSGDDIQTININSDTTIEMIYTPVKKDKLYEQPVVFYDYDIQGSKPGAKEETTFANNKTIISFKYQGTTYTDYVLKVTNDECYVGKPVNTSWDAPMDESTKIVLTPGTVLEEVDTNEWAEGYDYISLEYKGMQEQWGSKAALFEGVKAVSGSKNNGINAHGDEYEEGTYLAMGAGMHQDYKLNVDKNGTSLNANINNGQNGAWASAIIPNLVTGLSGENYLNVDMGTNTEGKKITEPGYFSLDEVTGKKVYTDQLILNFEQVGDVYTLNSAYDKVNNYTTPAFYQEDTNYDGGQFKAGDISREFFPLDKVADAEMLGDGGYTPHNWYFGMRYDLKFRLGEYVGPLYYTFKGDDDVWVFLNGERILDLGGIHSAFPDAYLNGGSGLEKNTVDLWDTYFGVSEEERQEDNWWEKCNSKYDPNQEYQLTVLYMERGGFASSCYMEFVMPDLEDVHISERPGKLEFVKKDSVTDAALEGVGFTLYKEPQCINVAKKESRSDKNGTVTFNNISKGTYYMKETTPLNGYLRNDTIWKVEATGTGINGALKIEVSLLQPEDDDYVEVAKVDGYYTIYNEPVEEEEECTPVKAATVVDWSQRVFEVKVGAYHEGTADKQIEADVIDYIDSRFEVVIYDAATGQYKAAANGAEIAGGTLTLASGSVPASITWKGVKVGAGNTDKWGFSKSFYVRAKEEYLGGNDIATNVNDGDFRSGIVVDGEEKEFPQPKVNVKIDFTLGEAEDTIFLGEDLTACFTPEQQTKVSNTTVDADGKVTALKKADGTNYDISDVTVTLVWKDKDGNVITAEEIRQASPEQKREYQAVVTVTPKASVEATNAAAESMMGEDGILHAAETTEREGSYTVYVIDGALTITKSIDAAYARNEATSNAIKDNQSFVFKVERFDLVEGNYIKDENFGEVYETIQFTNQDAGTKSKQLVGLKKGYYKITEEQEWSWKYKLQTITDTDHYFDYGSQDDAHYLFVGNQLEQTNPPLLDGKNENPVTFTEGKNTYFGAYLNTEEKQSHAETEKAEITFYNKKGDSKWLGDVSAMINKFVNP